MDKQDLVFAFSESNGISHNEKINARIRIIKHCNNDIDNVKLFLKKHNKNTSLNLKKIKEAFVKIKIKKLQKESAGICKKGTLIYRYEINLNKSRFTLKSSIYIVTSNSKWGVNINMPYKKEKTSNIPYRCLLEPWNCWDNKLKYHSFCLKRHSGFSISLLEDKINNEVGGMRKLVKIYEKGIS